MPDLGPDLDAAFPAVVAKADFALAALAAVEPGAGDLEDAFVDA